MRKFALLISTFCFLFAIYTPIARADAFCDGWQAGYKAGYCYGKGMGCLEPLTPLCPLARLGESTFQDGYNRGFLAGVNAQR